MYALRDLVCSYQMLTPPLFKATELCLIRNHLYIGKRSIAFTYNADFVVTTSKHLRTP